MELEQAVLHLQDIRSQLARVNLFRGYRSGAVGLAGVLGLFAAGIQAACIPAPLERLTSYLTLWLGVAFINVFIVGLDIWRHNRQLGTHWERRASWSAIEQFTPALLVGVVLTQFIACRAPTLAWMLPGVWSLLFSVGVFASSRILPKWIYAVGLWYFFWGVVFLTRANPADVFAPWMMGAAFGVGHLLTAGLLKMTLETGSRAEVSR